MKFFVDSAAHIALLNRDDPYHAEAVAYLRSLVAPSLVTSRFVLAEVLNRGAREVGARAATLYVQGVLDRPSYTVLPALEAAFDQSMDALRKYEDQGLSFVDSTNVVLMRGSRIRTIFTFDRVFRKLGFEVVP